MLQKRFRKVFENPKPYGSGLQHGERVEASRDERRPSDGHVAVAATRHREQARNERPPTASTVISIPGTIEKDCPDRFVIR